MAKSYQGGTQLEFDTIEEAIAFIPEIQKLVPDVSGLEETLRNMKIGDEVVVEYLFKTKGGSPGLRMECILYDDMLEIHAATDTAIANKLDDAWFRMFDNEEAFFAADEEPEVQEKIEIGTLEQELTALETWWKAHDPDMLAQLAPGCTDGEIQAQVSGLVDYHLPADLRTMYRWHNGIEDDTVDMGVGHPFLPLELALGERALMLESLGEAAWSPAWMPIMGEGDEGLMIVLDHEGDKRQGVYYYNLQDDRITLRYESLASMMRTIRAAHEDGLLKPSGQREEDDYEVHYGEEMERLRFQYNPGAYPFVKDQGDTVLRSGE